MGDQKRKQLLVEQLETIPGLRRKQLIERCVALLGYTEDQQRNRRVDSPVTKEKSRLGMLLTALLENGDIEENEVGRLTAKNTVRALAEQDKAAAFVLNLLQDGKEWSKPQIFEAADHAFTGQNVHSVVGQAIAKLCREKRIRESRRGYVLSPVSEYPNTELGNILLEARNGGDLFECFISAIHVKGGEWFELFAVRLLSEYYRQCGKTLEEASVTGGSEDGGLDGILEVTDWLGFRERILMQMKNRYAQITPKDVREFYGAVCAEQGSRGVYVTISTFHPEAWKLIHRVDNLVGLDGKKLFEIAKLCRFGIRDHGSRLALDDDLFLDEMEQTNMA